MNPFLQSQQIPIPTFRMEVWLGGTRSLSGEGRLLSVALYILFQPQDCALEASWVHRAWHPTVHALDANLDTQSYWQAGG